MCIFIEFSNLNVFGHNVHLCGLVYEVIEELSLDLGGESFEFDNPSSFSWFCADYFWLDW